MARRVFWAEVGGVAVMMAAISLMWLVYRLYIGSLLNQLGLGQETALVLFRVEDMLAIAIEPICGGINDRLRFKLGSSIPLIFGGALAAASIFMLIPAVRLSGLGVGLILLWAIAMAVFRVPAMALLANCADPQKLPQANSWLTMSGAVVGGLRPWVTSLILGLGAPVAFGLASFSLVTVAGYLNWVNQRSLLLVSNSESESTARPGMLVQILAMGLSFGWGVRLTLAQVLPRLLPENSTALGFSLFFAALGVAGIAIAKITPTSKKSQRLWLFWSTMVAAICLINLGVDWLPRLSFGLLLAISLGVLFNGMIPLVIGLMPQTVGLAIGVYSAGIGVANFAANWFMPDLVPGWQLIVPSGLAALCWLCLGLFVIWVRYDKI